MRVPEISKIFPVSALEIFAPTSGNFHKIIFEMSGNIDHLTSSEEWEIPEDFGFPNDFFSSSPDRFFPYTLLQSTVHDETQA